MKKKPKETDLTKMYEFFEGFDQQLLDGLRSLDRLIPSNQTSHYTHALHHYVAKFMPQYPNLFIRLLTGEKEVVLDPMCGSGTTLVEAILNGRNGLGIDIDPLARLITKVSVTLVSEEKLQYILKHWLPRTLDKLGTLSHRVYDLDSVPNHKIWFRDEILVNVMRIRDEIEKIDDEDSRDLVRVALSRIIKEVSNADPRDVMPEINHAQPVNDRADVRESFGRSLDFVVSKLREFNERIKLYPQAKARIVGTDARKMNLKTNSVDLIVTSPPYAYAMDYGRVHKLSFFALLGMKEDEMRKLSAEYVGTDRVSVKTELKDEFNIEFAKPFLDNLANKNKRRALALHKYLIDMRDITAECTRVLKPHRHFVYVIGNSTLAKDEFSTAIALRKMGESLGLKTLLTYERPYYVRRMSNKRASHSAVTKSDVFIVFKKTEDGVKKKF